MKTSLLLLPFLASFCAVSRADLAYIQTTTSPFGAMMGGAGGVTSKVYAKGDSQRTEAAIFGRKMITIMRGAKQVIQVDPKTKTYAISNMGSAAIAKGFLPAKGKVPTMNMTVAARKLGAQNVRGTMAPHWMVDMTMKMTTPRGPQNMKMGMEVWSSNVAYPISSQARQNALQAMPDSIKAIFGGNSNIKGDLKGIGAAFKTVPLRMRMMMNGQPISTTETTGISTKPLPASLFALPSGCRRVSTAQFNQAMQDSMRKSLSGMMKNMPGR